MEQQVQIQCPNCKTILRVKNTDNAIERVINCPKCQKEIRVSFRAANTTQPYQSNNLPNNTFKHPQAPSQMVIATKNNNTWVIILLALVLAIFIGFVIWFFFLGKESLSSQNTSNTVKETVQTSASVIQEAVATETSTSVSTQNNYTQTTTESLQPTSFQYIIIAGDDVCLRSQPNESSKMTGSWNKHFDTGFFLYCVGQTRNYYKVIYDGNYYYVPKRYARPRNTVTNQESSVSVNYDHIVIAGDHVCLRSQPNESSKMMGSWNKRFNTGNILPYVDEVGNYYKVIYDGSYYYIPKKYGRLRLIKAL